MWGGAGHHGAAGSSGRDDRHRIGVEYVVGGQPDGRRRCRCTHRFKVTLATLTTPFGESRLALCKAETFVVPGVAVLVVGGLENSAVLPPATEAIVTTLGSKVIVSEYAPSGVVLTSTVSSAVNCCPARTTLGQLNVAWAAYLDVAVTHAL